MTRAQQGAEQLLSAAGLGEPAISRVVEALLAQAEREDETPAPAAPQQAAPSGLRAAPAPATRAVAGPRASLPPADGGSGPQTRPGGVFLVGLAVAAGLAEFSTQEIIEVMALGWLVTVLIELVAWRCRCVSRWSSSAEAVPRAGAAVRCCRRPRR